MIISTTPSIEGRSVAGYLGVVAAQGVLGVNVFKDVAAGDVLAAFLCFRIFDIAKPFPLRRLEAQPGGWGIMLDDLVAGLYANVLVRVGLWAAGVV